MDQYAIIVNYDAIGWDEEKESTIAAGTKVCFLCFKIEDLEQKNPLNDDLGVTIFMANLLPKLNKKLFLQKHVLSLKTSLC